MPHIKELGFNNRQEDQTMSNLTRFNRMFGDAFFDDFFRPLSQTSSEKPPAIDVHESDGSYVIKADLPGISKDDINISLENGILSIRAETSDEKKEEKDGKIIRQERHYGQFLRQLSVGSDIDPAAISAEFSDGVLRLELPKLHEEPRRDYKIEVR